MQPILFTPLLQCFTILEEEKNKQNELVEEDVELKPSNAAWNPSAKQRTRLQLEFYHYQALIYRWFSVQEVKEESQYSDEPESEPVPNPSQSDVKSRVSNTILKDGSHSVTEAESPVT